MSENRIFRSEIRPDKERTEIKIRSENNMPENHRIYRNNIYVMKPQKKKRMQKYYLTINIFE
jgi:hypothetical protein